MYHLIKKHVEDFYYKTKWVLPNNFVNWVQGLRPYLEQRALKEEIRSAIDTLVSDKKVTLRGLTLFGGTFSAPRSDVTLDRVQVVLPLP